MDNSALANLLIDRTVEAADAATKAGATWLPEHPEDLGRAYKGDPASIWQWESIHELVKRTNAKTVALRQDKYQKDLNKPSRLALGARPNLVGRP